MANNVQKLRDEWEALNLKLLVPAIPSDEALESVLRARKNLSHEGFVSRMPLTVAYVNGAAQKKILKLEKQQTRSGIVDKGLLAYGKLFARETAAINKVLFGVAPVLSQRYLAAYVDSQKNALAPQIGTYKAPRPLTPVYLTRLGSLPLWSISEENKKYANEKTKRLITVGSLSGGEEARQQLRAEEILRDIPLGAVALILGTSANNPAATLVCPSPERPTRERTKLHSVWFRSFGATQQVSL